MTTHPSLSRPDFALEVVRTLRSAGFQALWAGGCVRDLLLGLTPTDYDVATDARPEEVLRLFRRTIPVGISFGVVRVLGPRGVGEVEVATFRSDGAYVDGRRPSSVVFSSPEQDAQRRDFTINGMFLDPIENRILDFVGGQDDLRNRILRAIGDPFARFTEDKLRLIRAVRFAARLDLRIHPHTDEALRQMAPEITAVAPERIAQELRRILVHPSRASGISALADFGILPALLPDLLALPAADDSLPDPWSLTLRTLELLPSTIDFPLALAALLHTLPDAPRAVLHASANLRLSNSDRDRAVWLVSNLDRLAALPLDSPSARKRLLAEPDAPDLLTLARAVAQARSLDLTPIQFAEHYLAELPEGPLRPPPLLTGNDLVALGLPPGPRFKTLLDAAYDAQLNGLLNTRDDALSWARASAASG